MKKIFFVIYLSCLTLITVRGQIITLAITNCNVITMKSDKILKNQTILLSSDKILKILPANKWTNKQVKKIDGKGLYIIPALTDMHVHANSFNSENRWFFPIFLSYGITTLRFMSGDEGLLAWRDSVRNNQLLAPDIHVASQLIDGKPPVFGQYHLGPIAPNIDSVEFIVNDQMSKGYEFIKLYSRLEVPVYKKFLQVCNEKSIKVTGHIPVKLHKEEMLTNFTGEIEHLSGYGRLCSTIDTISEKTQLKNYDYPMDIEGSQLVSNEKIKMVAKQTAKLNIWNCPTLVLDALEADTLFCKNLPNTEIGKKITPLLGWWNSSGYGTSKKMDKYRQFKREMIKELNTQNSKLLAGTDCPNPWLVPGLSLHQELQQLVLAGLTNYEALKTATVNPAIWFGGNYIKGTLDKGKQADLIILTDNPLKDIKNTQKIKYVIYKGKVLDREK